MCHCGYTSVSLCVTVVIPLCPCVSLWLYLCVLVCHCGYTSVSLCVTVVIPLCPCVSLWLYLCVLVCHCGYTSVSLCVTVVIINFSSTSLCGIVNRGFVHLFFQNNF